MPNATCNAILNYEVVRMQTLNGVIFQSVPSHIYINLPVQLHRQTVNVTAEEHTGKECGLCRYSCV